MSSEKDISVVLDTCFLISLLDEKEELHRSAFDYFKYFLEHKFILYVSTVSVAEYCARGHYEHLPWNDLRVIPFNLDHARLTGKYASILFKARHSGFMMESNRMIIPNDTKIFAQAELTGADYFVTADSRASKAIACLAEEQGIHFSHIDIHIPYTEVFSELF